MKTECFLLCVRDKINILYDHSLSDYNYYIKHRYHRCYKCGKYGHIAANCGNVCEYCCLHHTTPICSRYINEIFGKICKILVTHKEKIQDKLNKINNKIDEYQLLSTKICDRTNAMYIKECEKFEQQEKQILNDENLDDYEKKLLIKNGEEELNRYNVFLDKLEVKYKEKYNNKIIKFKDMVSFYNYKILSDYDKITKKQGRKQRIVDKLTDVKRELKTEIKGLNKQVIEKRRELNEIKGSIISVVRNAKNKADKNYKRIMKNKVASLNKKMGKIKLKDYIKKGKHIKEEDLNEYREDLSPEQIAMAEELVNDDLYEYEEKKEGREVKKYRPFEPSDDENNNDEAEKKKKKIVKKKVWKVDAINEDEMYEEEEDYIEEEQEQKNEVEYYYPYEDHDDYYKNSDNEYE